MHKSVCLDRGMYRGCSVFCFLLWLDGRYRQSSINGIGGRHLSSWFCRYSCGGLGYVILVYFISSSSAVMFDIRRVKDFCIGYCTASRDLNAVGRK